MSTENLESLIEQRKFPLDGIHELQRLMVDSFRYYDLLVSLACHQRLNSKQFSWALGYCFASLWVFKMNARGQAIEQLRMKDLEEIETNDFHLSRNFKTSSVYTYQIVASTDMVKLFVKYIRPHVIPPDIDSEEAVVFCTFAGTALHQGEVSKKLNQFFLRYGYDLNVTRLRSIISTHLEELIQKKTITPEGNLSNFLLL